MPVDVLSLFVALPIVGLTILGIYFLRREWTENEPPSDRSSRGTDRVGRVFTGVTWLLALVYVIMGVPKLSALSDVIHQFEHWGYSETFMYLIGAVEFLGAILLLMPRIRLLAASVLSAIMAGAIYTHLAFDPAWLVLLPTACLAMLVFVGYESFRREWKGAASFREATVQ